MNEKIEYILSSLDFIHNLENKIKNTKKKFVTKSGECKLADKHFVRMSEY